ncbi:hypothetical protein HN371_14605 [Candidatus Poribacteria bacterium]|jgi:hypothetical protein|nr:hypothetical protein [Candidatus Poribacteria bacterium]MBT5533745.1 hypothetical protein [Candidatus Poribacteria bacterium]MBT5712220.1 hypothetical protein [Candidatus Poribacteria bacterium]MBT7806964.1 hypothetical protein [Candidatus Poribacteria bacterium]
MIARALPVLALLITTLATACSCPSLTTMALRNGAYRIDEDIVALTDGEYRHPVMEDSAMERVVTLTDIVEKGDLDGRGGDDAAVILIDDPGGSGTFYHLAVLFRHDDVYENVATEFLGDRIQVQSVVIDDMTHGITVHALVRNEGDAMAVTPEVQVAMRYMVVGGRISPVRQSVPTPIGNSR